MFLQCALSGEVIRKRKMDAMLLQMDGRKEITNALVAAKFLAPTLHAALMNAIYFVRICMMRNRTEKLANLDAISTQSSYQVCKI